ncbi:FHA domain-containing protein [Planctomycetota bacterium]
MRLTVTQDGKRVHEAQFVKGPIHIGRHPQSQIFLASPSVSRQQAVVFLTEQGQWMVKDMQSGNKTILNGKPLDQSPLHDRDRIGIGDYAIEVRLVDNGSNLLKTLEDTQIPQPRKTRGLVRELDDELAPPLRVPACRTRDLLRAAHLLTQARGEKDTHKALLDILRKQFRARRIWAAFRHDTVGPMAAEGGRLETLQPFALTDPTLKNRIEKAREEGRYILLLDEKQIDGKQQVLSAIIAPIPGTTGNLGAFYVGSYSQDAPYAPSDLDYAVLLSIDIGIVLENF